LKFLLGMETDKKDFVIYVEHPVDEFHVL